MDSDLQRLLADVPHVHADRQYWFIRTEGGAYYHAFLERGLVGIGYTKINTDFLQGIEEINRSVIKRVTRQVTDKYRNEKRPGFVAAQILTFTHRIKKGDVIIIPGVSSRELSFGIVDGDDVTNEVLYLGEDKHERKVRKVKWLKSVNRRFLNPNLFSLFFAHQTISNGDDYAKYIDTTLNDFFIKDGKAYLQLPVQKADDINARDLFKSCLGLLDLTDKFLETAGYTERTTDVDVKININSPGIIEFVGGGINALAILGFVIVAVNGGSLKIEKLGVDLKTEGILHQLTKFLNGRSKREIVAELKGDLNKLEMKDAKDIIKVIETLDK